MKLIKKAIYLKPKNSRPDFRLVASWLWGEEVDYDSDGNSYNPASRTWTELYLSNRETEQEQTIRIAPQTEKPLILKIRGSSDALIARVAYFLMKETNGELFEDKMLSEKIQINILESKMGKFDLNKAFERVKKSIWRQSTLKNPYPNL